MRSNVFICMGTFSIKKTQLQLKYDYFHGNSMKIYITCK